MYLQSLNLYNFRNYSNISTQFSPRLNILLGDNAQGKTNLLESIYFLALARSHRVNNDKNLIRWGHDLCKIKGNVFSTVDKSSLNLEIVINKKGKKASVNSIEQPKLSQYIGNFNVILFSPEDLSLIKGSSHIRRRFIDREYSQINLKYLYISLEYKNVLKQRNKYLKQLQSHKAKDLIYLDVLSDQLSILGSKIITARLLFISNLQKWAELIYNQISQRKEKLIIKYLTQIKINKNISFENQLKNLYLKYRDKEIERGMTLIGPHRDDISFLLNNNDVHIYGSQGQQRTIVLSIKLAEVYYMYEQIHEYPVLLLDDVLSELDLNRQKYLLNMIKNKAQTFLTTPSLSEILKKNIINSNIIHISQGSLLGGRK